ncbi:MAG: hypothetical protein RLZZ387_1849 [Chloroflexota bacterium]|jgi:4-amino-4-deoxy-L-arabinose transferase-like glycosyltransferase
MVKRRIFLLPVAIFLLALALRLFAIDRQSLWYDEGLTVALAQRAPAQILRDAAADVHPPLYYWALHLWIGLLDTSEAAARSLSALSGAAAAALTAILGRRWFGSAAAIVSGVAAAVSPLAVHYGQEARMYAMAALLAALLWLALDLWRETGRARWLALYALAALAALFTHYFMVTVVAAAGLAGLALLVHATPPPSRRRERGPGGVVFWLLLHAALAAAYLPLAWGSRERITGWSVSQQGTPPIQLLGDVLRHFALGPSAPVEWWPLLLPFAALLLVAPLTLHSSSAGEGREATGEGLLTSWGEDRGARVSPAPAAGTPLLLAAAWLLVPLAAIALLSLSQPYYRPRFLLPALPAFHLLLGAGAAALAAHLARPALLARSMRHHVVSLMIAVAALVLASVPALAREYTDPRVWRDDYRGLARAIGVTARPNDAVVLVGPGQTDVLDYYLKLPLRRYPLPSFRPLDPVVVTRELEMIAARHSRLYAVYYVPYEADPAGVIEGWLRERAFRGPRAWYGGVELVLYELGEVPASPVPVDILLGDSVRLRSAAFGPTQLRPGDALRFEATWVAERSSPPLLAFVHLLAPDGSIAAQFDGLPAAVETQAWEPGAPQRGRVALLVPPDAPAGTYQLIAGLYDPATGTRLLLPDNTDYISVGMVEVDQP